MRRVGALLLLLTTSGCVIRLKHEVKHDVKHRWVNGLNCRCAKPTANLAVNCVCEPTPAANTCTENSSSTTATK